MVSFDHRFEVLSQQLVSQISNMINSQSQTVQTDKSSTDSFLRPPQCVEGQFADISNLAVTLKEPLVPKAIDSRVTKLNEHQHFDKIDWKAVRYVETQKKYLAYPSFVELKINEELAGLADDSYSYINWPQMERSFAALSNAFIAQNENVNASLQTLLDWASTNNQTVTANSLYEKMKEVFDNQSKFKTVSQDVLQIICGKRSECIEARRRAILKCIGVKYIRQAIDNIPPSAEYLFNPTLLSQYISKIGGIDKLKQSVNTTNVKTDAEPQPCNSKSDPFLSIPDHPKRTTNYKKPQSYQYNKNKIFQHKNKGGKHNKKQDKQEKPRYNKHNKRGSRK